MAESIRVCPACGHDNLADSQFCGRCGAALPPPASEASSRELDTDTSRFAPSAASETGAPVRLWQRLVIGVAALVLLALAVSSLLRGMYFSLATLLQIIVGAWLGFAAFRPPSGILRRVIVAIAFLVILIVTTLAGFAIAYLFFYF